VTDGFRFSDYAGIYRECRRAGLGLTVHAGETGGPDEVREAVEALEPDRIGHGVRSAEDPNVLGLLRERGTVLEVCPTSNLITGVVRSPGDLRRVLMRQEILSNEEVRGAIETGERASLLDRAPVMETSVAGRDGGGNGHAPIPVEVGS
jgi:hypothetical protein